MVKPKNYDILGPRARQPHKPDGVQIPLSIPQNYQVSFDKHAFSELVRSQGIRVTHYRAIPDPRGMTSRGDTRGIGHGKRSSDGYLYKDVGVATVFFSSNSQQVISQPDNTIAHATSYISLPETYDGTKEPILLCNWDRFYLKDIEVRVVTNQFLETSQKGVDRLQFPATCVEHLIDSDANEYQEKKDFEITPEGHIKWLGQYRPQWNPELNRGAVYSIRYRYTPFFIVNRIIHEIRVAQITDQATFERRLERLLYQVEVVREHVFLDVNNQEEVKDDVRYQNAPPMGGIGSTF